MGARLDKAAGWFRYVNVIYIHNGVIAVMEREMAYTADVNQWRGRNEEPYRRPSGQTEQADQKPASQPSVQPSGQPSGPWGTPK